MENIPRGHPSYLPKLDRDNDGVACEADENDAAPTTAARRPTTTKAKPESVRTKPKFTG